MKRLLITLFAGVLFLSCQKTSETDDVPTLAYADITGDFEGPLTTGSQAGYVMISFEQKDGNVYTCSMEGTPIAEVTVQGNSFFATTQLPASNFDRFDGAIREDLSRIDFIGEDDQGASINYYGNRNESGQRIPAEITIDGKEYAYFSNAGSDCDDSSPLEFSMSPSFIPNKELGTFIYFDVAFEKIPVAGTYFPIDGLPSGNQVDAAMMYNGIRIQATAGTAVVTGDGTSSGVRVQLDNLVFDEDDIKNEKIPQVLVNGTIYCRN